MADSLAADFLVLVGLIVSLIFIYALLLIVRNRQLSHLKQRPKLCPICQESNLNCSIIFNKLHSTVSIPLTSTRRKTNKLSNCARCGITLSNINHKKQEQFSDNNYGKLDKEMRASRITSAVSSSFDFCSSPA